MEQDSRVRPMSREENAAYRGVTVNEDGAEEEGRAWEGDPRTQAGGSSVRYIRIGSVSPHRSLLTSLVWAAVLAVFLILVFFVALPAVLMVGVGLLLLWAVIRIAGRGRILAWIMRRFYGR